MSTKILVVEDDYANQRVATIYLEKFGYQSEVAENGAIAVKFAEINRYKLILMDCQMPVMDGFTAAKLIRKAKGLNQDTPIIALTANLISGISEQCYNSGMDDILNKPVAMRSMKEMLAKWCG